MLFIKRPKCGFLRPLLHFLGHMILPSRVAQDPLKVAAIYDMAAPTDILYLYFWGALTSMRVLNHSMPPSV